MFSSVVGNFSHACRDEKELLMWNRFNCYGMGTSQKRGHSGMAEINRVLNKEIVH